MIKTATASIRTGSLKVILTDLKFGEKCKLIITFYLGISRNQRSQIKKQGIPTSQGSRHMSLQKLEYFIRVLPYQFTVNGVKDIVCHTKVLEFIISCSIY